MSDPRLTREEFVGRAVRTAIIDQYVGGSGTAMRLAGIAERAAITAMIEWDHLNYPFPAPPAPSERDAKDGGEG